jgi:hypothetical protein
MQRPAGWRGGLTASVFIDPCRLFGSPSAPQVRQKVAQVVFANRTAGLIRQRSVEHCAGRHAATGGCCQRQIVASGGVRRAEVRKCTPRNLGTIPGRRNTNASVKGVGQSVMKSESNGNKSISKIARNFDQPAPRRWPRAAPLQLPCCKRPWPRLSVATGGGTKASSPSSPTTSPACPPSWARPARTRPAPPPRWAAACCALTSSTCRKTSTTTRRCTAPRATSATARPRRAACPSAAA